MASEVEICNRALQKLGAPRIVALTEDSVSGNAANNAYIPVRDSEIRLHIWNFAKKRGQWPASATSPLFVSANHQSRTNAYPWAADCLRVLPSIDNTDWLIEGREILTDDSAPIDVLYLYRVADPNQFTADFIEAFSAKLAMEMNEELTQSNKKYERAERDYLRAIRQARQSGAFENISEELPVDDWLSVRL